MTDETCTSLTQVRDAEYRALERLSKEANLQSGAIAPDQLMGLALSGGGIRSATFNLGVLQALCELKLLKEFDYLSTVSGGGYIGSWLSAWIKRAGDNNRSRPGVETVQDLLSAQASEPKPLRWLRSYSNYLTPKTGLLSTDTLAGVATYLRNFILNITILISLLSFVLLVPRVAAWAGRFAEHYALVLLIVGLAALAVAIFFIDLNLANQLPKSVFNRAESQDGKRKLPWYSERSAVVNYIVVPLVVAGLCLSYWAPSDHSQLYVKTFSSGWRGALSLLVILLAATVLVALFWEAALKIAKVVREPGDRPTWRWRLLGLVVGLGVGLGALLLLLLILDALGSNLGSGIWHTTVLGVPGLLAVFGLGAVFVVGTSGRQFEEDSREWWSRLGGILFGVAGVWTAVAAAAIYGPWAAITFAGVAKGVSIAWLITSLAGVRAANSAASGNPEAKSWREPLAKIAPAVFIAGLLVLLAYGIHCILEKWGSDTDPLCRVSGCPWQLYAADITLRLDSGILWLLVAAAIVCTLFFSWRIDVNVFSFHMFYRNRLVRCYLGASNPKRRPHPFTGFDGNDSPCLKDMVQRPYHLLNTALNITRGDRLAWQERKAASFVLSPLFCGYDIESESNGRLHAYQPTADYTAKFKGCIGLGGAFAISGAAASPNQGYHSTPAVAFLLTVFNVRLGWWMQNPARRKAWEEPGPRWGFQYLLSELFGATDETSKFVYLSDGGHFDNLGIYELVKRRCRFIVVCDAGCDGKFQFEDLGNAIRKCNVDLGVSIEIDTRAIIPHPETRRSLFHCAVGTIHYERLDDHGAEGYLLYIKPSLSGSEPLDVLQYAKAHSEFPHEPTGDQWFSESQFESYRKLGQHVALAVFDGAGITGPQFRESMFVALKDRWYRPSAAVREGFSKHVDQLKILQATLRGEENLRFLDAQIYPEWGRLMAGRETPYPEPPILSLPTKASEVRAGFYFCANLLELMESAYLDLNLEEEYDDPDNRGWINLFKHWSWSSMLRATYGVTCATYGSRFQNFCKRRLDLLPGEMRFERRVPTEPLDPFLDEEEKQGWLNFVETDIIRELADQKLLIDEILVLRLSIPDPSKARLGKTPAVALEFTVGFAAMCQREFIFFRVQDHLRRMGLARAGLKLLCQKGYKAISERVEPKGEAAEDGIRRFRLLLESVLRELGYAERATVAES